MQSGADPDQLPLSLRDVLLARVERLDPSTQRLLRIAAAGGPRRCPTGCSPRSRASTRPSSTRRCARPSSTTCSWSTRPSGGYVFRHALTRDAIYGDTLPRERVRIHTAYGEALSADPALAGGNVAVAAALALHWRAAHDLPRALEASIEAAQLAAAYAPAEALGHLERALEIWPQVPDAAERSGIDVVEALRRAGQSAYAAGALDRSLGAVRRGARRARARCRSGAPRAAHGGAGGDRCSTLGRDDEARLDARARRGAAARRAAQRRAGASVLTALASQRAIAGDFAGARSAAEQAVAAATAVGARGARGRGAHDARDRARLSSAGRQRPAGARGGAAARRGGRRPRVGAPRPPEPVGRAADPRPLARRRGGRGTGTGAGGARRPHALGLRGAGRRSTSPRRCSTSAAGTTAHRLLTARDGQRAGEPVTRASSSITAPGSPRSPGATTTPRRTSTPHGDCCRRATAASTPSPARSPPPRWRGRSATAAGAREEVRRALEHEALAPMPRYRLAARVAGPAGRGRGLRARARAGGRACGAVGRPARDDPAGARLPRARGRRVGRAGGRERTGRRRSRPAGRAGDPYLLAYALLRQAEVALRGGDREGASAGAAGGRAAGGGDRRRAAARRRARARAARAPADRRGRARGSRTWPGSTRSA